MAKGIITTPTPDVTSGTWSPVELIRLGQTRKGISSFRRRSRCAAMSWRITFASVLTLAACGLNHQVHEDGEGIRVSTIDVGFKASNGPFTSQLMLPATSTWATTSSISSGRSRRIRRRSC